MFLSRVIFPLLLLRTSEAADATGVTCLVGSGTDRTSLPCEYGTKQCLAIRKEGEDLFSCGTSNELEKCQLRNDNGIYCVCTGADCNTKTFQEINDAKKVKYEFASGAGELDPSLGIRCLACGIPTVDITGLDKQPFSEHPNAIHGKKYNDTCANYEKMIEARPQSIHKFVRTCPKDVKSCFFATGELDGEIPEFRGCAAAGFEHDNICTETKQAATVIDGKRSEDVTVNLCYCNSEKCNTEYSTGNTLLTFKTGIVAAVAFVWAAK